MPFLDLNVCLANSRSDSERNAALADLHRKGYEGCALAVVIDADKAVQNPDTHGLSNQLPNPLPFELPSKSLALREIFTQGKQVKEKEVDQLNINVFSRITLRVSSPKGLHLLNSFSLNLFNIIALQPMNQPVFDLLVDRLENEKLPEKATPRRFELIHLCVESEIKVTSHQMSTLRRSEVFVEFSYGKFFQNLFRAEQTQDEVKKEDAVNSFSIFTCENLRHVSRGHLKCKGKYINILFSSGKCQNQFRKPPQEVIQLAKKFGIRDIDASSCVSEAGLAVLRQAEKRRRASGMLMSVE